MALFSNPTSFRLNQLTSPVVAQLGNHSQTLRQSQSFVQHGFHINHVLAHSQHPPFARLLLLICEAVLEVVCVSLPGYIIARQGMFEAEMQKFVANLNVMLFTPCLSRTSSILIALV